MNKVTVVSILLLVGFTAFGAASTPGRYAETHTVERSVNCSVCHERAYSVNDTSAYVHFSRSPAQVNSTSVTMGESHDIDERTTCITCHEAVTDEVLNGTHIQLERVSRSHPNIARTTLEETHYLHRDRRTDTEIVDDACLSCHSTHRQFHKFAVADPYLHGGHGDVSSRIGLFVELRTREWPVSDSYHVVGEENPIAVTVANRNESAVGVNVTVQLEDYANHQTSKSYGYHLDIEGGQTASVQTPAVLGDYFTVDVDANRSVELRVAVEGTYNDVPNATVRPPATLPNASTYEPTFYHTESIYRYRQLDDTLREWGDWLQTPHAVSHLTIYQRQAVVRNESGYRFDAPTMLYYLRRNATQLGQYYRLGANETVYTHETGRVTTLVCASCHLHAIGDENITETTCGGDCHSHRWGVG